MRRPDQPFRDQPTLFGSAVDVIDYGKRNRDETYRDDSARRPSQRGMVLARIANHGIDGVTREQLADEMGLPLASVCGRVRELKDCGEVVDTPNRRVTRSGKYAAVVICREFINPTSQRSTSQRSTATPPATSSAPPPPDRRADRPTTVDTMGDVMPDQITCPTTPCDQHGETIQAGRRYTITRGKRTARVQVIEDIDTGELLYVCGHDRPCPISETDPRATWEWIDSDAGDANG
ncbi:hypothetical protein RMSM_02540 [Rhodopirellula maiorica SM1]|uniref:Uncharacterized protein n=1 Tax=Rhodopirellula maiorica SM1 TaxID=1265738 RepID=M5RMF6_9BACT|nr:MarR family transcriptional regulator [Rhodopirellula maiorica]EMI20508.1 hypothetical protein RMSM_02540 [Rhodopirellula maiorica SM1]